MQPPTMWNAFESGCSAIWVSELGDGGMFHEADSDASGERRHVLNDCRFRLAPEQLHLQLLDA